MVFSGGGTPFPVRVDFFEDAVPFLENEEAVEEIAEDVRRLAAGLVVEVKDGGQPLYPLQMVAE